MGHVNGKEYLWFEDQTNVRRGKTTTSSSVKCILEWGDDPRGPVFSLAHGAGADTKNPVGFVRDAQDSSHSQSMRI